MAKFTAWLDADGHHVWQEHRCNEVVSTCKLPHPHWHATGTMVTPSVHCLACGAHEYVTLDNERAALRADLRERMSRAWNRAASSTPEVTEEAK